MDSESDHKISDDYIRGLVEGEGTFTFSPSKTKYGRVKIPAFSIKMHIRDKALIEKVRDKLGLKNRVYVYHHKGNDGANRGPQAMLIVREINNLKDVIVPFFYRKLKGNKAKQFDEWIHKIWKDSEVPHSYKLIYKPVSYTHLTLPTTPYV